MTAFFKIIVVIFGCACGTILSEAEQGKSHATLGKVSPDQAEKLETKVDFSLLPSHSKRHVFVRDKEFSLHAEGVPDLALLPIVFSDDHGADRCGVLVVSSGGKSSYASVLDDEDSSLECNRIDAVGLMSDPTSRPRIIIEAASKPNRVQGVHGGTYGYVLSWDKKHGSYVQDDAANDWLSRSKLDTDTVDKVRELLRKRPQLIKDETLNCGTSYSANRSRQQDGAAYTEPVSLDHAYRILGKLDRNLIAPVEIANIKVDKVVLLKSFGQEDLALVPVEYTNDYRNPVSQCGAYVLSAGGTTTFASPANEEHPEDCSEVCAGVVMLERAPRPRLIFMREVEAPSGDKSISPFILSWSKNTNRYDFDKPDTDWLNSQPQITATVSKVRELLLDHLSTAKKDERGILAK